ncbi:hypothetical protein BYI23_A020600 [Burkholderia sp. YI23]|nr:hypothetical protein BYI23_A020600 [Burkholderia sp. YI23]
MRNVEIVPNVAVFGNRRARVMFPSTDAQYYRAKFCRNVDFSAAFESTVSSIACSPSTSMSISRRVASSTGSWPRTAKKASTTSATRTTTSPSGPPPIAPTWSTPMRASCARRKSTTTSNWSSRIASRLTAFGRSRCACISG